MRTLGMAATRTTPTTRGPLHAVRRPDASMDLLRQILEQPVDPDYAAAAARGAPPSRARWMLGVALLIVGVLFSVGALQTNRSAPAVAKERAELIDRVHAAQQQQSGLHGNISTTSEEIRKLRAQRLGTSTADKNLTRKINELDQVVGQVAVVGPGLHIVVDDSASRTDEQGHVLDIDLQQLANGLWAAGAEAVSINGYRLTSLTAIRGAGDAITVDYRSLTRPYRIDAIGDPNTFESRFAETPGGEWWNGLHQNLGMRYEVSPAAEVTVPGDSGMNLRYAKEKK